MEIIFTGANYWLVNEYKKPVNGAVILSGRRWIKATKQWSKYTSLFACLDSSQVLTQEEIKQQGLE